MSTSFGTDQSSLMHSFMSPQWKVDSPDFSNQETIDTMLHDIYPKNPLIYLLSKIRSESLTNNNMFSWFMDITEEIEGLNIYAASTISCASSAHGTTFSAVRLTKNSSGSTTSGDLGFLCPGKVITFFVNNNTTQINFKVTAVTNQTTVDLKLLTNTPGVNIVSTDYGYLSGNLFAEGDSFANDYYTAPFRRYGSMQLFQNNVKMTTEEMKQIVKYSGSILEYRRKSELLKHHTDMEKTILWSGQRYGYANNVYGFENNDVAQFGANGREVKTASIYQVATQPSSFYRDGKARAFYQPKSSNTIGKMQNIVDTITKYQKGSIIWLCGREAKQHICDLYNYSYPEFGGQKSPSMGDIDLSVRRIVTREGFELNLIEHPLLQHGVLANQVFSIDLDYITLMSDFRNKIHIRTPEMLGAHRYEENISSQIGLKVNAGEGVAFMQFLG